MSLLTRTLPKSPPPFATSSGIIPEPLKSIRMGHRMPGIGAAYSHVTQAMLPGLLTAFQRRWQRSGGQW